MISDIHYNFEKRFLNYLLLNGSFNNKIGLFDGKAAVALYSYYTNSSSQDREWSNSIAFSFLEEIVSQTNSNTSISYGNGIAGIGVLLEHFSQQGFLKENTNELLEESEPYFVSAIYGAKLKNINIANGISGLGLYFLHRLNAITPPSIFQQMRLKECVVACVDQISNCFQQLPLQISKLDLTVYNGLSGTCLFLNWLNKLKWYEPWVTELLQKTAHNIFEIINNTIFSWQKAEAYFSLLHCDFVKRDKLFKKKVLRSFNKHIEEASFLKQTVNFYEGSFMALWLRLIAEENNVGKAKLLSRDIKKYVTDVLKKKYLNNIFPYNTQEHSVRVGLQNGVCGTALPLLSLETGDYSWLSIWGINVPSKSFQ